MLQILLKLYVCKLFFFPWADEITDLCGNVKMTVGMQQGTNLLI